MNTKRILTFASIAILAIMSLSCERIENGNDGQSGDGNLFIKIKSVDPVTKSTTKTSVSYLPLYNEDGTENKDFVLECTTVPMGAVNEEASTKAALYGSGRKKGSGGILEDGSFFYYEYKKPIVLDAYCSSSKTGTSTHAYDMKSISYDETLDLWVPDDNRIWKDDETYIFRAHLPEKMIGVDINTFGYSLDFNYEIPTNTIDQQDIMFGYYSGDKTRQEKGYKIADIPFRHALASVRFMVYLADGGDGHKASLYINKLSLENVYLKGNCTQTEDGEFTWTPITDNSEDPAKPTLTGQDRSSSMTMIAGEYTNLGEDHADGDADKPEGNDFVFTVIPQNLAETPVRLVLDCTVNGDDEILTATIGSGKWESGVTTVYRLTPQIECEPVDLGLSVIWGNMNLGAFKTLETGWFFRWGETTINYGSSTYKYYGYNLELTKYTGSDGLTVLQPEDDAATRYSGAQWRTPTIEEGLELIEDANITSYSNSWLAQNSMFLSTYEAYEGNAIAIPSSESNPRVILTSTLASDPEEFIVWNCQYSPPSVTPEFDYIWDNITYHYGYHSSVSAQSRNRGTTPCPVRPVIPVLTFDALTSAGIRPDNIITASAGSTVSFTLAEEYTAQSWTAEADGSEFTSGSGSGSIVVPSATKVVIKRDTGVIIGTINVQ